MVAGVVFMVMEPSEYKMQATSVIDEAARGALPDDPLGDSRQCRVKFSHANSHRRASLSEVPKHDAPEPPTHIGYSPPRPEQRPGPKT